MDDNKVPTNINIYNILETCKKMLKKLPLGMFSGTYKHILENIFRFSQLRCQY